MDKSYLERIEWEERCAALEREEQRKALLSNPDAARRLLATLPAVWRDARRWEALLNEKSDSNALRRRRARARLQEEHPSVNVYVGLHMPNHAQHFRRCMISVNRIRARRSAFAVSDWMLDSGAFMELKLHGGYRHSVAEYATQINRWQDNGQLVAAVAQDYMCEPFMLERTGLSVAEHQRLTIARYDALLPLVKQTYVMPVLQGYQPHEYVSHIRQYGRRLESGAWVGVGSVCKRNGRVGSIEQVLYAIHTERPDLRLHGFGIKETSTKSSLVRQWLHSVDSMAWSYAERRKPDGDANDWRAAAAFVARIEAQETIYRAYQHSLFA